MGPDGSNVMVQAREVQKYYGEFHALRGVSLDVPGLHHDAVVHRASGGGLRLTHGRGHSSGGPSGWQSQGP